MRYRVTAPPVLQRRRMPGRASGRVFHGSAPEAHLTPPEKNGPITGGAVIGPILRVLQVPVREENTGHLLPC